MGVYERWVCPQLTEWALNGSWVSDHRRALLAPIGGRVLEVGFGSGLNLRWYPPGVERLDLVDPAEGMHAKARRRLASAAIPVWTHPARAECLPFDDDAFDAVVCTFTLCSIPAPVRATEEMRRVLRTGGTLRLFEHVASRTPAIRTWQDRLNPVQNVLGCGCNLNRDPEQILGAAGFVDLQLERIEQPGTPRIVREHLIGHATKTG